MIIYICVSIPLTTGYIPDVIQKLEGITSKRGGKLKEYEIYFKQFYRRGGVGKRATGYFICTAGNVNDK